MKYSVNIPDRVLLELVSTRFSVSSEDYINKLGEACILDSWGCELKTHTQPKAILAYQYLKELIEEENENDRNKTGRA